jgi:hypothetical protein
MPGEERILTLHTEGKKGKNILLAKYTVVRDSLLEIFTLNPEISHKDLIRLSNEKLKGKIEGNISWYMETVLLDLIARGRVKKISEKPVILSIVNFDDLSFH